MPLGEGLLRGQGAPRRAGEAVGLLLAVDEPGDGRGPVGGGAAQDVALVKGALRIPGEEEAYVRGDLDGAVLVLLAGEAAGRAPAGVRGGAGLREAAVEAGDLAALVGQLLLGRVVRLRGLLGLAVQTLKVRQEFGDGALGGARSWGRVRGCGVRGQGGGGEQCGECGSGAHPAQQPS
ncbi:hypothetical protein SMD44_05876 [Streptomyces alboflavus]|uniref:Uncharacterized protein n=1 Tax=Streptomyces alboflavus TaxID=67267 RepID=A0A1Z1WIX9_9ACTN|nr:hypothetical protein SMD44_05876 [Streptomyces alboflavus]